jgi:MoxR-like ATPase
MHTELDAGALQLGRRLVDEVLRPMKQAFVGKDEVIDLLGAALVARENLFILGPPGTAKSALVHDLARRVDGRAFEYLLTRFTEPNEVFGPFDIRRLRDGELITNTEGMLPEAEIVFLDELLNANSAILNSLLMVLNERVFRRGRETRALPALMFVGASNRLPQDDALAALFDRFILRVYCDNVPPEELSEVLAAGWSLEQTEKAPLDRFSIDDVRRLNELVLQVDFSQVRPKYVELVRRLRHAGVTLTDRRAVKLQRLLAASALLCGRLIVNATDLWVMRYVWDTEEQQQVLASLVGDAIATATPEEQTTSHHRARGADAPDPEHLARDLDALAARLVVRESDVERSYVRDQLGVLAARCQWVAGEQQRSFLDAKIKQLWEQLGAK